MLGRSISVAARTLGIAFVLPDSLLYYHACPLYRAIAIYSGLTPAIGPGNAPQQSNVVQRGTVQLRCEHAEIGAVADRSRNGSGKSRRRAAILSPSPPCQ